MGMIGSPTSEEWEFEETLGFVCVLNEADLTWLLSA